MLAGQAHAILVQVHVRADLLTSLDSLHVNDLCTGELVGVLDWTLSNLLVADGVAHCVVHCAIVARAAEVIVSLVSVLVTLCTIKDGYN